jgi:hypothetical protein
VAESVAAGAAESVAAGVEVSVAAGVAVSVVVVSVVVVVSSAFFWQPARAIEAEAITRINAVFFMCVSYISLNVPDWLSGCTNTPVTGHLSIGFLPAEKIAGFGFSYTARNR